jgi:hypothetical protein
MRRTHRWGALRRTGLSAATTVLLGCSDGSGPGFGTCPQTYEFGNVGCARVQGVVRDEAGTPLADVRVHIHPVEGGPDSFDGPMHVTNVTGAYSLEIHDFGARFGGQEPRTDPVPMNLLAFLTGTSEEPVPSSGLIPVTLRFAAVGEVPEVLVVDITIDTSP